MAKAEGQKKQTASAASKMPQALMPNSRLFLFFLVLFAAATYFFFDWKWLPYVEGAVAVALIIYSLVMRRSQRRALRKYIESVTFSADTAKSSTLQYFPLPMVVFRPEDAQLIWANQAFFEILAVRRPSVEMRVTDVVPSFSGRWLMEGHSRCPELVTVGDRLYQIHGNLVRSKDGDNVLMAITYWVDVTEYEALRREYQDSRPNIALFVIDNYDELIRGITDRKRNDLREEIEDKLLQWCDGKNGFFRHYDRDRYLFVFEDRYLPAMRADKFRSLLESVHSVVNPVGIRATLSVGIGRDGSGFEENFNFAVLGVDMALSRGGDQAVLKNRVNFEFYGGRGGEIETRTKVKSRVMASALRELINDSSGVYVMGHKISDLDALGAAAGVCCIARKLHTPCQIVIDREHTAAKPLLERLRKEPFYANAFLSPQDALLRADSHSLLIVVDTNRPNQVEDLALLESCTRVAVIDHHRRAADYITNPTLSFHEPNASSTCELIAELLEEITDPGDVLRVEAEAVLSGIMLDTKNFNIRTGERTFDAAAFLRRSGADTAEVKKLLQSDLDHSVARYRILQNAQIYAPGIALVAETETQDRIVAAQAADELLNVAGVECSVVVYPVPEGVFMSARSIGPVNVQLLLEPMGGGGNRAAAAALCRDLTMDEAMAQLKAAIDAYETD